MNLMFWKKKTENEGGAEEASGMLARIRAQVAALTERFGAPPPFKAEVAEGVEQEAPTTEGASPEADAAGEHPDAPGRLSRLLALFRKAPPALEEGGAGEARPAWRVNLIVVAVLLLLLLLGAFGYAVWSIVRSAPDPKTDVTDLIGEERENGPPLPIVMPASAPSAASDALAASAPVEADASSGGPVAETHAEQAISSVATAPASHPPETELEALRRKNAELQAQIEALKKAQRSSASVKMYPGGGRGPAGGVATVGSSDPSAAAATLKEAIEAMNAGTNYQKKPDR